MTDTTRENPKVRALLAWAEVDLVIETFSIREATETALMRLAPTAYEEAGVMLDSIRDRLSELEQLNILNALDKP